MTERPVTKLGKLDLSQFDRQPLTPKPTADEIDRTARLPRRDPVPEKEGDDQVNIRGRMSVIRRFKALCKHMDASQVKVLELLMDEYEKR